MLNRRSQPSLRINKYVATRLLASVLTLLAAVRANAISTYDVSLNTTAIAGASGTLQMLAFDLIDGDLEVNNTITATGFSTDGMLPLSSDVVLEDTGFFNEELRDITFGTYLNFTLELTDNSVPPGFFDQFSFFILDENFLPLFPTTDGTGADALFVIDITGEHGGRSEIFDAAPGAPNVTWSVTLRQNSTDVPDVAQTGQLFALAFGTLLLNKFLAKSVTSSRRKARSRSQRERHRTLAARLQNSFCGKLQLGI